MAESTSALSIRGLSSNRIARIDYCRLHGFDIRLRFDSHDFLLQVNIDVGIAIDCLDRALDTGSATAAGHSLYV
jgi:hypothetical protein